jgi:hypothetical protein
MPDKKERQMADFECRRCGQKIPDTGDRWEMGRLLIDHMETFHVPHAVPSVNSSKLIARIRSEANLAARAGQFERLNAIADALEPLMVDDEDRVIDWIESSSSARIGRVMLRAETVLAERFADGVFE